MAGAPSGLIDLSLASEVAQIVVGATFMNRLPFGILALSFWLN
jgi:hypothetical protein